MTATCRVDLAGVSEPFRGEHGDGVEQPKPMLLVEPVSGEQRSRHERIQVVGDVGGSIAVRAHDGCRVDRESTPEHRHPAEQLLEVGVEQVVAPTDRRLQRAVTDVEIAAVDPQHRERSRLLLQLNRCRRPRSRRHQLDAERQSVEVAADLGDHIGVVTRLGKVAPDPGSGDEQLGGLLHGQRQDVDDPFVAGPQRLATGRQHRDVGAHGQNLVDELCDRVDHMLAGVEIQQHGPLAEELDDV